MIVEVASATNIEMKCSGGFYSTWGIYNFEICITCYPSLPVGLIRD